ncbi:PD-(D/E)XK nuclease family protein [Albidovulum sp.]|uniref:PD-(D/E)XK nuclease family protein n=1 Tax=Albidovulum sp. TaxID=1872424 RepID=UPI0035278F68
MFAPDDGPRLFALPPGVDFPRAFVAGLLARGSGLAPEELARATVYLNSGRMLRRVRAAFDDLGAVLVPRLRVVTDFGAAPIPGIPPAVSALRRRLELAERVGDLMRRIPDFAPGRARFDLADSLARLLNEMQSEGVAPEALETVEMDASHARHWERSLAFTRIVARFFEPDAPLDPDARQRLGVEAALARWASAPPEAPVIVAGSTGSRGATQLLMQGVARLAQGAIVFPGFDFDMPEEAWNSLSAGTNEAEDHPQYRFWHLSRLLGLAPSDIRPWTGIAAPDPARNRLVSLALRPAPVTDRWMSEGARLGDLGDATRGLTLIEAPSPRIEAQAIALCLRASVAEGRGAALITPDRTLARRVSAVLDRWGIQADDSAGQPLMLSAPGRLLRHTAALLGRQAGSEDLLVLLKHPLTATGCGGRGDHLRFTRDLELHLRRRVLPFPSGGDLRTWGGSRPDPALAAWTGWLAVLVERFAAAQEAPLSALTETHLALAEAVAAGPDGTVGQSELWQKEAGIAAAATMAQLRADAGHAGPYMPGDYQDLVTTLLGQEIVRPTAGADPRVAIWGTLEARAQGAEVVILAGLNEAVWPEAPDPDPWLSRQMRRAVGLPSPERQIGLAAHDFQQGVAAPEVVLSRSLNDGEAETVASRWLARITNLLGGLPTQAGGAALDDMRRRGERWILRARALDAPRQGDRSPLAARPAPRPPVAVRPAELPVTGIQRLIRDPYAIYAARILRLKPLNPLRPMPDARIRGDELHRILERFVRERPESESAPEAAGRLMALTESLLDDRVPWPAARRFWMATVGRIADRFARAETERARQGRPEILERPGALDLSGVGFRLIAKPDRIDLLTDGRVHIYDYKTGEVPTAAKMRHFDKQLLLEALMAEGGGFERLGRRDVAAVSYIALGASGSDMTTEITAELMAETAQGLLRLVSAYGQRQTGYIARRAVFETRFPGDYDHLARFGEWQMSDAPVPEDVG